MPFHHTLPSWPDRGCMPWGVTSTLQVKVKYLTNGGVVELVGSQSTTRQCMVAMIDHHVIELSSSEMVLTL